MYKPTGFVSARMIAKKRRIWRMPTLVIRFSEKALHHGGKEEKREDISPCPLFLRGGVAPRSVPPTSELLRLEHRPAQIHEEQNRNDAGQDVIEHGCLLRAACCLRLCVIARLCDAPQDREANQPDRD